MATFMNPDTPEDTGRNQAGQFTRSGNVSGRPRGSKSKTTLAAEALMQGEAEGITRKCIEMALSGDTVAIRLVLDRVLPIRKARVRVDLPELHAASDIVGALGAVAQAVGRGELTPEEAASLGSLLNAQVQAIELVQFRQELDELRKKVMG